MKDKYFRDTRPGIFLNHIYKLITQLIQHPNPPTSTAITVKDRYGNLVWKEPIHLIPATKQDFLQQRK